MFTMHFDHSYLPFYTGIPHPCSLLKNLSFIVLSICFVFWPTEFTQDDLCHCGFGATHWSLVSSAMILCLPEFSPNLILGLISCSFPLFSFISLIIFDLLKTFIPLLGEFHTKSSISFPCILSFQLLSCPIQILSQNHDVFFNYFWVWIVLFICMYV